MEYRKLSDLVKNPSNPRTIKKNDLERLKASIMKSPDFFEARPLLLSDRTGELVVIGGNQRYEASRALGLERVPTYLFKGLDEAREKEIIIRDNISNGEWDWDLIANEWDELPLEDWGLNAKPPKPQDFAGEIDFTEELGEKHNYIVLYFDNEIDWLNLVSRFDLDKVKALDSKDGYEKMGVGRVVNGARFLNEIQR